MNFFCRIPDIGKFKLDSGMSKIKAVVLNPKYLYLEKEKVNFQLNAYIYKTLFYKK